MQHSLKQTLKRHFPDTWYTVKPVFSALTVESSRVQKTDSYSRKTESLSSRNLFIILGRLFFHLFGLFYPTYQALLWVRVCKQYKYKIKEMVTSVCVAHIFSVALFFLNFDLDAISFVFCRIHLQRLLISTETTCVNSIGPVLTMQVCCGCILTWQPLC